MLATAGSACSITEISGITLRPEKVVGFHWFPGARLVEVVEGDDTSESTVQAALSFAQTLRKTAVRCADSPGLIVER